jgi:hypothetical protein
LKRDQEIHCRHCAGDHCRIGSCADSIRDALLVAFSAAHYVTTACPSHDAYEVDMKGTIREGDLMGLDAVAILRAWDEARHAMLKLPYDRSNLIPWVSASVTPFMADVMADKNICTKWPEVLLKTGMIRKKTG